MPKIPIYLPIKLVSIELYYEDAVTKGSNSFATVQELAEFLKDNPELAKAVKYISKKQ
jgi:hypothetical protein